MKIDSFSTDQFAGICELKKSFSDGMNVVFGDNEAGKSTMIYAIYCALAKPVKLNRRSDAEFMRLAFPSDSVNTIDACVEFSDGGNTYLLEKVWDRSSSGEERYFRLKCKGGAMFRGNDADEKLREILKYGTAVYDNLIFGRQSNEENILSWCYDFFSEQTDGGFDEARRKLSEAFSAADGISAEKILGKLDEKLNELGNNWDFERDCPKSFSSKKYEKRQKNVGSILGIYYQLSDLKDEQRLILENEKSINIKNSRISELKEEKIRLRQEYDFLLSSSGMIAAAANAADMLAKERSELAKAENDAVKWENCIRELEYAKKLVLLSERIERKRIAENISEFKSAEAFLKKYPDISDDYKKAAELSQLISRTTAAKFTVRVIPENGIEVSVSSADGDVHVISEADTVTASGFADIVIPDAAKIKISPECSDAEKSSTDMMNAKAELKRIFDAYSAEDMHALEDILNEAREKSYTVKRLEGMVSGCDAENFIYPVDDGDIPENADAEINDFLGRTGMNSLEFAVGHYKASVGRFAEEYSDVANLRLIMENLKKSISKREAELDGYSGIPRMSAAELEMKLNRKKDEISENENSASLLSIQKAELEAENRNHDDIYEINDRIEALKISLADEKKRYMGYVRIKSDFERIRSESDGRLSAFYGRFNEYLSLITDKRISMECKNSGLKFKSGGNYIAEKSMLSEGTKKTVLLAFRLAVLSYFFPDGGGFIVLDDDLLDMDRNRRIQAAELLKKFAEKNQVIFVTCDESVSKLLGGNIINMNEE